MDMGYLRINERGLKRNANVRASEYVAYDNDLAHGISINIAFDSALSKNNLVKTWFGGINYAQKTRDSKDTFIEELQLLKHKFYNGRVYLDIFVEEPKFVVDAINFLDIIADAIKVGIGVDDRWFVVRRIDWAIVKDDPRIKVDVSQMIKEDYEMCSACGIESPLTQFRENVQRARKEKRKGTNKYCL